MEIDGHCCAQGIAKIEVEKVRGKYSNYVRIKIRGAGTEGTDVLTFACWGVRANAFDELEQPEVIIIDKDERDSADASDEHSEESDR